MAKTPPVDPTLDLLRRAVEEANDASVPVTLSVHGMQLEGELVSDRAYHAALVRDNPLLGALDPHSELADKQYAENYSDSSVHFVHVMGRAHSGRSVLWRVREDAVDAWSLTAGEGSGSGNGAGDQPSGFARLFGAREA